MIGQLFIDVRFQSLSFASAYFSGGSSGFLYPG
jgi:hypothetical protein